MAPNATNPTPGRAASVIHWLVPSREHLAITIAVAIVMAPLGLPLWAHLLFEVLELVSAASSKGPPEGGSRQQHGTTLPPVMGPPLRSTTAGRTAVRLGASG